MPRIDGPGGITFTSGDMLDPGLGRFDFVVAMDSLIHYTARDIVRVLSGFAERTTGGVAFTFAPKTPALAAMHSVGKFFPKSDRAPAIEPVAEHLLRRLIIDTPDLAEWMPARTKRVARGFYTSQAMELRRP
jgi:magnesium-protoporphyrin O-methyltransferase